MQNQEVNGDINITFEKIQMSQVHNIKERNNEKYITY